MVIKRKGVSISSSSVKRSKRLRYDSLLCGFQPVIAMLDMVMVEMQRNASNGDFAAV
jgi:hypothetical protein